jgi:putative restriction endonuclease
VSRNAVAAPLESAHLRPYRGPESNTVSNGPLLRADIHTLFDLRLLAPEPLTRNIVISKLLTGTQYQALSTCRLAEPESNWEHPDAEALGAIWWDFLEAEDGCRLQQVSPLERSPA